MQHAAQSFKEGRDWEQANDIIERGKADRINLEDRYRLEYDMRVEVVRKRLIDKAGEFNLDHPTPSGNDKFDEDAIKRQAHREVQFGHENDLQQSRETQNAQMDELQGAAHNRNLTKKKNLAKNEFELVSDRRKAPDRRIKTKSKSRSR